MGWLGIGKYGKVGRSGCHQKKEETKKKGRGETTKMRHIRVILVYHVEGKFESVVPYLQTFQLFCRQSHANVHPGSFHCNGVKETSTMGKRVKSGGE